MLASKQLIQQRLHAYFLLMRFDKPIGTYLLLWPALWGLWIAGQGQPSPSILLIFILGTIVMRAAGCVMNDIADRHIDHRVARTQNRPLTRGDINLWEAWGLLVILGFVALGLVLVLNQLTIMLAVAGLVVTLVYPFCKRVTHLPQFVLGIAFSWSIPMAFAAQLDRIPRMAGYLFITAYIWPVIYDTFYAMADRDDDIQLGVKSTAILFGRYDRLIIAGLQILFLVLLLILGFFLQLGWYYKVSLLAAAMLFAYQQWLARERSSDGCFAAFLNNHWVGLVIFAGLFLSYLQ